MDAWVYLDFAGETREQSATKTEAPQLEKDELKPSEMKWFVLGASLPVLAKTRGGSLLSSGPHWVDLKKWVLECHLKTVPAFHRDESVVCLPQG